jgi:CPA2 family monovalent cation:H+ antiporter-2
MQRNAWSLETKLKNPFFAVPPMEPNPLIFRDLTYIYLVATAGGFLAWALRLPLILGFVVGGIFISPFTPGLQISDVHMFQALAEAGVVLLMFSIGVEFSVPDLLRVKWVAVLGGGIGVVCSILVSTLIFKLLGWSVAHGAVIGATISVASTMVLARMLTDHNAMNVTYGRVMIGITIVEDLAVVLMTIAIPSFASDADDRFTQTAWSLGKAFVFLVPLGIVSMKVVPKLLRWAKATMNMELVLLMALSISLGTAAIAHAVGLSAALGAFLAGLSISASKDLHDAHDRLIPVRDVFVALFFVSLGTLIEPEVIRDNLPLLGVMLGLIIVGKFLVWLTIVKLFGYSTRTAISVAVGLTQIGELSFVIVQTAANVKLVSEEVFNATLAASLISIFINVFLVRVVLKYVEKKFPPDPVPVAG